MSRSSSEPRTASAPAMARAAADPSERATGSAKPLEAIAVSLEAVGAAFRARSDLARRRHAVIAASAELQERELVRLASVVAALAQALRERGVSEPAASVTAETAIAVFRNAFERWATATDERPLTEHIGDSLDALRAVTA
jgi:hypothetical protein